MIPLPGYNSYLWEVRVETTAKQKTLEGQELEEEILEECCALACFQAHSKLPFLYSLGLPA